MTRRCFEFPVEKVLLCSLHIATLKFVSISLLLQNLPQLSESFALFSTDNRFEISVSNSLSYKICLCSTDDHSQFHILETAHNCFPSKRLVQWLRGSISITTQKEHLRALLFLGQFLVQSSNLSVDQTAWGTFRDIQLHSPAETPQYKPEATIRIQANGDFSGRIQFTREFLRSAERRHCIMGYLGNKRYWIRNRQTNTRSVHEFCI